DTLSHPTFTTDEDFLHAVGAEWVFRNNSRLVLGWDQILAKNPDDPFLNNQKTWIRYWRGDPRFFDDCSAYYKKHPDIAFVNANYAYALFGKKRYAESLDLYLGELVRDANN